MEITEKQIVEIADNLDAGMICYYNLKTGEIKSVPDFDSRPYAEEEAWEDDLEIIDDNRKDYFKFTGFESRENFRIMVDFAESIEDKKIQAKLFDALDKPKPFKNFKFQIDNSGEYRSKWFEYKAMRQIQNIKEQIDDKNSDDESSDLAD